MDRTSRPALPRSRGGEPYPNSTCAVSTVRRLRAPPRGAFFRPVTSQASARARRCPERRCVAGRSRLTSHHSTADRRSDTTHGAAGQLVLCFPLLPLRGLNRRSLGPPTSQCLPGAYVRCQNHIPCKTTAEPSGERGTRPIMPRRRACVHMAPAATVPAAGGKFVQESGGRSLWAASLVQQGGRLPKPACSL